MRIALIFAIFAPIQLCSFGRNDIGVVRIDTWRGPDTQRGQDASISVDQPVNNTIVQPGQELALVGSADFIGAFPEEIEVLWSRTDQAAPICTGNLDASGTHRCLLTVPQTWRPGVHRLQFHVQAPWGQTQDAFVALFIEQPDPDPTGPADLFIGSPALSSSWNETSPVPFVATLRAGETPLIDARIVWEVDGLQVSGLTARTDSDGTIVRAERFAVGPHEALATVFVDGAPVTASTRFIVTTDQDPDTDTDSDSDSQAPSEL